MMIRNIPTESEKEEKLDTSPMIVASVVESATSTTTEITDENSISPPLFDLSSLVQTRDCLGNHFCYKNSKLGRGEERGGEVVRIKLKVFTEY